MERIKINISNFKFPRLKMEALSLTRKEEIIIEKALDKLESLLPGKAQSIFSITKQDDHFSGSLKIDSVDIYAYAKDSSPQSLFLKLRKRVEAKIHALDKSASTYANTI